MDVIFSGVKKKVPIYIYVHYLYLYAFKNNELKYLLYTIQYNKTKFYIFLSSCALKK